MSEKKETRLEAVMRLLGDGKSIKEVAEELGIAERLVRSYKWRSENPEAFKKMLDKYYTKRKARLAAEKKAEKHKKTKKPRKLKAEEAAAEDEETEATVENSPTEKHSLEEVPPPNPWTK